MKFKSLSLLIYILFISLFLRVKNFYNEYVLNSSSTLNIGEIFIESAHASSHAADAPPSHGSSHSGDAPPSHSNPSANSKVNELKKSGDLKPANLKDNLIKNNNKIKTKDNTSPPYTPDELVLLQQLSERRAEIDKREKDLDLKINILAASEANLQKKIEELNNLKQQISALIEEKKNLEGSKIMSLVKIYENMKPKEAAKIFNQLDLPLLISIFKLMKEAKIAPILSSMDAAKAKEVSSEFVKPQ